MDCCEECFLLPYCLTQKAEYESCNDMLLKYNANLLLQPEMVEKSVFQ